MLQRELFRTSIFRLTAFFAFGSVVSSLILFSFIYWQTAVYERERISRLLEQEASSFSSEPEVAIHRAVETHLAEDFHRVTFAALFDANGKLIVGNIPTIPPELKADDHVHSVAVDRNDDQQEAYEGILAIAKSLPDHRILVIGRSIVELEHLRDSVIRSLLLGVIPALLLALIAGAVLSQRVQRRVIAANASVDRIMRGNLQERLPVAGKRDDFDRLAVSVNRMLDEIERMVNQIRGVTENIAHDLRTPLTRMQTRLERTRHEGRDIDDIDDVVNRALKDLDLTMGIITALLRISELADGRRKAAFSVVDLSAVVRTVCELYEPIAEEKNLTLVAHSNTLLAVRGDKELLIEAVANLVDNAIKFTPAGGLIRAVVQRREGGRAVVGIADTGPGIPEDERGAVFQRFYRSKTQRHVQGHGLGLSLVKAIAELHGFTIQVFDGNPGTVIELVCQALSEQTAA